MTARERTFQRNVATMYQRAAKGHEEYVWMQGRYERLKAQRWPVEVAFRQAEHEAQIRFYERGAKPAAMSRHQSAARIMALRSAAEILCTQESYDGLPGFVSLGAVEMELARLEGELAARDEREAAVTA